MNTDKKHSEALAPAKQRIGEKLSFRNFHRSRKENFEEGGFNA
jgi:hypothetical protein